MHRRQILAAAGLAVAVAGGAQAEGFYTYDLGVGGHYEQCYDRAARALRGYALRHSGADTELVESEWSIEIYNLQPGDVDVQILCPYRNQQSEIVLMVGHSEGLSQDRERVIHAIRDRWNDLEKVYGAR